MTDREPTGQSRRSIGSRWRMTPEVLLLVVGVGGVAFFGWLALGAPGDREVAVVAATVVVSGVGIWFVAPEFYEIDWMRMLVIEFFAAGALIVFAYRLVFDLLPVHASPYLTYSVRSWLLAGFILQVVIAGAAVGVMRRASLTTIRQTMVVFGVTGLAVAITAASTYTVGLGYTVERWGLVAVGAAFGFYPILAIPTYALLSGIVGCGWALTLRTRKAAYVVAALVFGASLVGVFNYSVVRDPFWGLAVLAPVLAMWSYLFVRYPEFAPMVAAMPRRVMERDHPPI